jgi:alkylation response protein AidB-like acyl-CoA dehydrogenase
VKSSQFIDSSVPSTYSMVDVSCDPSGVFVIAAQVAERAASQVVETFGGNGYSTAYPAEKLYLDARIGQIYEGRSNILLRTIARHVFETVALA